MFENTDILSVDRVKPIFKPGKQPEIQLWFCSWQRANFLCTHFLCHTGWLMDPPSSIHKQWKQIGSEAILTARRILQSTTEACSKWRHRKDYSDKSRTRAWITTKHFRALNSLKIWQELKRDLKVIHEASTTSEWRFLMVPTFYKSGPN